MIAISWDTIKSLALLLGPWLIPRAIGWYNSAGAAQRFQKEVPIRPLPTRAAVAILILVAAAALFAIAALPVFAPENVFAVTRSNPTASNKLILARLANLRPLTHKDDLLRDKLESKASKLLYFKYGPSALVHCAFCNSQEPSTYLLYAAPAAAAVHLLNAAVVGLATSWSATGPPAAQWRPLATAAAAAAAATDLYLLAAWDPVAGNDKARLLAEVSFFHWRLRAGRHLALAALDLVLAGLLYLSATDRMFPVAPSTSDRVDAALTVLARARNQVHAAGIIKNTAARDAELRTADARYWAYDLATTCEAMQTEDVVESIRDAVQNGRINLENIAQSADVYARDVLQLATA